MSKTQISIQIIRVYSIEVEAETAEDALTKAIGMQTTEIEQNGHLTAVFSDYAEIVE